MIISCYILLNVIRNRFPHAAIDSDSNALKMHSWVWVSWVYWRCGFPHSRAVWQSVKRPFTFQELVARYSGALAFLQTQHQSAAAMLVQSQNES